MSFVQRLINVTVQLAPNTQTGQPNRFVESGTDTVTLSGLRTSVRVQNAGAPIDNSAQIKIWGMTPSLMLQLSTLGLTFDIVPHNTLLVKAGDRVSGMATVYSGTIWQAYGDYSSQPDVPMVFECQIGAYETVAPAPNTSFTQPADAATVMQTIARGMGFAFENNLTTKIPLSSAGGGGPIFRGSYYQQAAQCADHAHIQWGIVNGQGGLTLAIWPWNGTRNTTNTPVISPQSGQISYPSFTPNGVLLKTLFNPNISFGGKVQIESSLLAQVLGAQQTKNSAFLAPTQSTWAVNRIDLALDSMIPHGEWSSTIQAWNPNYNQPLPQIG